jgi:hypothetical protein
VASNSEGRKGDKGLRCCSAGQGEILFLPHLGTYCFFLSVCFRIVSSSMQYYCFISWSILMNKYEWHLLHYIKLPPFAFIKNLITNSLYWRCRRSWVRVKSCWTASTWTDNAQGRVMYKVSAHPLILYLFLYLLLLLFYSIYHVREFFHRSKYSVPTKSHLWHLIMCVRSVSRIPPSLTHSFILPLGTTFHYYKLCKQPSQYQWLHLAGLAKVHTAQHTC